MTVFFSFRHSGNCAAIIRNPQQSLNKASPRHIQKQQAKQAQTDKSLATALNLFVLNIYPQGRISEHRINLTLYKLSEIVEGDLSGDRADQLALLSGENQALCC